MEGLSKTKAQVNYSARNYDWPSPTQKSTRNNERTGDLLR